MSIRPILIALPLFATSVAAAQTNPTTKPTTQPAVDLNTEVTGVTETPEQRVAKLKAELEKVESEFAKLKEIEGNGGVLALVRRKLANRTTSVPSYSPPAESVNMRPRLINAAEKSKLLPNTMFTVGGKPVIRTQVDSIVEFYKSYRTDEAKLLQDAMLHAALQIAASTSDSNAVRAATTRIREAEAMLKEGTPFDQVAIEVSDCDSKEKGGMLGPLKRGSMDPMFMQAVLKLEPGDRSGVFQSTQGFHIVECLSKEKGETPAQDVVSVRHILVKFSPELEATHLKVRRGQTEIAFVEEDDLKAYTN